MYVGLASPGVWDGTGYTFDLAARARLGMFVPKNLPTLGKTFEDVYSPSFHESHYFTSLAKYFEGGFLSQIEINTTKWAQQGLIREGLPRGYCRNILLNEIELEIFRLTGQRVELKRDFSNINGVMQSLAKSSLPRFVTTRFVPTQDSNGPVINALLRNGRSTQIGALVKINGEKRKIIDWGTDKYGRWFVRVSDIDGSHFQDIAIDTLPRQAFTIKEIRLDEIMKYSNNLVVDRMLRDHPNLTRQQAALAFDELKKWFFWKYRAQLENLSVRPYMYNEIDIIDYAWHAFLLFTEHYTKFGQKYFATYLHHTPQSDMDARFMLKPLSANNISDQSTLTNRSEILDFMRQTLGEATYQSWFIRKDWEP